MLTIIPGNTALDNRFSVYGFWGGTKLQSIADTIYYKIPLSIRYKYLLPSLITLRTESSEKCKSIRNENEKSFANDYGCQ